MIDCTFTCLNTENNRSEVVFVAGSTNSSSKALQTQESAVLSAADSLDKIPQYHALRNQLFTDLFAERFEKWKLCFKF